MRLKIFKPKTNRLGANAPANVGIAVEEPVLSKKRESLLSRRKKEDPSKKVVLELELIPEALFSDAFFKKYPLDFNALATILHKSKSVIKMMLSSGVKPWQIAALLGMESALSATFGYDLEDLVDTKGYTVLHYYVVGGNIQAVRNHLTRYKHFFKANTDEDYSLAEIAAAAGSVDILAIFSSSYGFDLNRLNTRLQTTCIHFAVEFDQEGIARWLVEKAGVDPRKGRNLVEFCQEQGRSTLHDYFKKLEENRLGFGDYFISTYVSKSPTSNGLLNVPEGVLAQIGDKLYPSDWAHLATSCVRLRSIFSKKIAGYKNDLLTEVSATRLIPKALFSDPLFQKYPINFRLLAKILKRSGPIVKIMLNLDVQPWQIAALLGMDAALQTTFGDQLVDLRDAEDYTVLHYYVVGGHRELVRKHISRYKPGFRAEKNEDYGLAEMAAAAGSVNILAIFSSDYGFDLGRLNDSLQITLIHCAVQFGQDTTVRWLIDDIGVDPRVGRNLVCFAAEHQQLGLYNYLTKQVGLSITNEAQRNALTIHLARCGDINSIKEDVREIGIDKMKLVKYKGDDLFSAAIGGGQAEMVKFCCSEGLGAIDQRWSGNRTLLHIAASKGQVKLVLQSLQEFREQLNIDMVDENNRTMLFSAAEFGDFENFLTLLALYPNGDEWLKRDINRVSIVHVACEAGKLLFLKELTQKFGDECLQQTDNLGRSALHYACRSRNLSLIEWLVQNHKLSFATEDATGKTPLHMLAEAAQERPQRWENLPVLAKRYGMDYVTDYPDQAGMSVKDYLESANQPGVLSVIDEMCRHQFARKIL